MIKVNNLNFSYTAKTEALKDVSFEIKKGTFVSILGHNGSGKSTLAKLLVGLLKAKSGDIFIDETKLTEESLHQIRKKIGIVFQNPDNQFVGVTVKHDIAFGLENQNMDQSMMIDKVNKYAGFVGMQDFLDKEPHQLSGGQKQRVAIAGILAMDQDYIILDEATSMLDPEGTRGMIKLIKTLNAEHQKTIISITHDLSFAALSDELIVLKEGQIILRGKPQDVFLEEEKLKSSNLELPLGVKVYNELKKSGTKNNDLLEALWAYNLTL